MKKIDRALWTVGLLLALALSAAASPAEFSLCPYQDRPVVTGDRTQAQVPKENYERADMVKKRPWIAAIETPAICVGNWLVDRYIAKNAFSYITWSSIKDNFRGGWTWDDDKYGESFFGHPYQGSQFYNSARSLGLNTWESLPYPAIGYFIWGFFFENDQPSINDQILDVLGGVNLGELEFRLSSQVLDDSATGGNRVWREVVAFLLNPIRGFNRVLYGDAFRTSAMNLQAREPIHGSLSFGGSLVSDSWNLSQLHFSPGVSIDLLYGADSSGIVTGHPFDLIVFNGDLRYSHFHSRGFEALSMYGPWYAKSWGGSTGQSYALGVFQHYDMINNEAFNMGGTSTTLGFISVLPLGGGFELKSSIQAGALLLGGVRNDFLMIGDRDYDYGMGFTGKVDAWLSHSSLGTLSLHFAHIRSWGFTGRTPTEFDESRDVVTLLTARYTVPIASAWAVSLDYGRFALRQSFQGGPQNIVKDSSRVGAGLAWRF